jgi:D-erythronate 2-dehydrogenase
VRILITGAGGFVGRALAARLLAGAPIGRAAGAGYELVLLDQRLDDLARDRRPADELPDRPVTVIEGDVGDRAALEGAIGRGVDCVFHLASVPGGAAEADFELGLRVNLGATVTLLEALRASASVPRFVFASTVGVYGVPMADRIDETTIAAPTLSYGAHKLIGEILVADYSRRGFIDGAALRLPGIVARPRQPSGMLSAFMSELLREVAAGRPYTCPVAASGTSWWMSRACVVDNLLLAASLTREQLARRRTWLLPVLHASMAAVVAALRTCYGVDAEALVTYRDDPRLREQFASCPPLESPAALAAGFRHDGTLEALVRRAMED